MESTKIGEGRVDEVAGSGEEVIRGEEEIDIEGTESDTEIVTELGGRDGEIETTMESTKIGEGRVDEGAGG